MATYHELVEVTCLNCNWKTEDAEFIAILNDFSGHCPDCEKQFFRWVNENGTINVSLTTQDADGLETYENLMMIGAK
jgi:hypothetical protein